MADTWPMYCVYCMGSDQLTNCPYFFHIAYLLKYSKTQYNFKILEDIFAPMKYLLYPFTAFYLFSFPDTSSKWLPGSPPQADWECMHLTLITLDYQIIFFYPREVVSRYRDPQLYVDKNYFHVCNLNQNMHQSNNFNPHLSFKFYWLNKKAKTVIDAI